MNEDKAGSLPRMTPPEFFNVVESHYRKAESAAGGAVELNYRVAGYRIRLSFAGDALISRLAPALAHLKEENSENPDFTIRIWDSKSTGVIMPPPPWRLGHLQKRGEIWGLNDDRFHTSFQWGSNGLSLLDRERELGLYWVNKPEQIPYWETSSPFRAILQIWLNRKGVQMVHAGAVGVPEGGVLLVGKGGSGKSTTALGCLDSELSYLSDDYTLIAPEPEPTAYSIYSTGKKNPDDVDRLPFLKKIISNSDRLGEEKALYFLYDHFPEKIIPRFPLKAVFIPRVTGGLETTLEATSPMVGLGALVPSTIKQLPDAGQEACRLMTETLGKLPCYYLNLGTDMKKIHEVIYKFLRE